MANPFLGVFFHWLGGLASASFYIPYRGVKRWSWETYWLVGGVFSWIIAPFLFAWVLVPDLGTVLVEAARQHGSAFAWAYIFGAMWGLGGLTFGLTMRYLGIALGMAVALGYCAAFGTLMPPIFKGEFGTIIGSLSGQITLIGVVVCLLGIAVTGLAGMSKERELSDEQKKETVQEFNFVKGILVATFSGIMSAAFSYGLSAGAPIGEVALAALQEYKGNVLWQNLPVLIVVLWGGFTTNFIWCMLLSLKNRTGGEYLASHTTVDEKGKKEERVRVPLISNYVFSAIAGVTWYLQFFFYSMGETQMGDYKFSSWTLHMASIIIFSSLWGIALREWKGTSRRTHVFLMLGLAVLIGSTLIVGFGNFLTLAATDDSAATEINTAVTTENVFENDSNLDSGPMKVTSFTEPKNGAVKYNDDGTFTYTPNTGFEGTDSFEYDVDDGRGGNGKAKVNITVGTGASTESEEVSKPLH